MASVNAVSATFMASIKSVGTAVIMSACGFYLHHRGFISKEGKRSLALMSQQVTFPLYFFTKIIYCNQDWSDAPCPDVTRTLSDTWMLLFWPCYMVGTGLLVGSLVAKFTHAPRHQIPSVLAATAFANNTALPITLLAVVHANFPSTSDLGRIDPTLFLSVYLVVYPILQWSLGGWILAPGDELEEEPEVSVAHMSLADSIRHIVHSITIPLGPNAGSGRHYRNVVNNKGLVQTRQKRTHGLTSTDESNYMTELNLEALAYRLGGTDTDSASGAVEEGITHSLSSHPDETYPLIEDEEVAEPTENFLMLKKTSSLFSRNSQEPLPTKNYSAIVTLPPIDVIASPAPPEAKLPPQSQRTAASNFETDSIWETIKNILDRTLFQPPVVGALLGILCAVTPARGYFVDIVTRHSNAPLQWLFDGLYKVGSLAVPDNMLILGCNLSASYKSFVQSKTQEAPHNKDKNMHQFTRETMIGIVIGKMLVMPFVGIATTYLLKTYVFSIPAEIAGAFYLVLMIVFITPTANNVMIMIELSGCAVEVLEGVANVIALQYAVAPVILSLTMTVAIGIASGWS